MKSITKIVIKDRFKSSFSKLDCFGSEWKGFCDGFRNVEKRKRGFLKMEDLIYDTFYYVGLRNRELYNLESNS